MLLSELRPTSKEHVYDLVRSAGLDVSDWANYSGTNPASNPKYCYEWAFWEEDKAVVLCLWFSQMRENNGTVYQELQYRDLAAASGRDPSIGVRANRARRMDMAFQYAKKYDLPVRAIVVDGTRRGEGADASEVESRKLDPVPWSVESYDLDTGLCRLVRGTAEVPLMTIAADSDDDPDPITDSASPRKLARIAYNSGGWNKPTGEAGDHESSETYNAKNRFGHEDWLFRAEWVIDGWRYAFIQGLNKSRKAYEGEALDVTLFTIQPDKRRRLVATIYGLEALGDDQARDAVEAFKANGWLKTMQDEVRAIGGNAEALGNPQWAEHVLNVRYRAANVDIYPTDTYLPDDPWIRDRFRYMLYRFPNADRDRVEKSVVSRRGTQVPPEMRQYFRRGTKPVVYTPEHARMQAKLFEELKQTYGSNTVWLERDYVDVRVETDKQLIYFEIKTDADPTAVLRQAMGQILEYAFHPARTGRSPDQLVIVGRNPLTKQDEEYVSALRDRYKLPISYRVVTL